MTVRNGPLKAKKDYLTYPQHNQNLILTLCAHTSNSRKIKIHKYNEIKIEPITKNTGNNLC